MSRVLLLSLIFTLFSVSGLFADPITVGFEDLVEGTAVTTQYPELTFSNAAVLTAGSSLDEFEFPPHSGSNVAYDNGGPMTISFTTPVEDFTGFFTYAEPLTVNAFDSSNTVLGSISSLFFSNMGLSGDPGSSPNELLHLSFTAGISKITITGDPGGGSFTMDDLTATPSVQVDEPGSMPLVLLAGLLVLAKFRLRMNRSFRSF